MSRPRRAARSLRQRLLAWLLTVTGGGLMGIALFLRAQVAAMRYLREQLDQLNFLERFLAEITFLWRTLDERLVLAIGDVPESYLVRSELAGNAMGMIAVVLLLCPLLIGQRRPRRRRAR